MSSDQTLLSIKESLLQAITPRGLQGTNTDNDAIVSWEDIETQKKERILDALVQNTLDITNSNNNHPEYLVYPRTEEQLAKVIAIAKSNKWRILTCGKASKLNWGGLSRNINLVVSTERLNQRIEHAIGDFTVTVDAGVSFSHLSDILAEQNQFLALNPTQPQTATLGGIVATADTGSFRQRYGSVRDQLLGITFVRHDGEIVKAGGKVVKNVAGYDLMKLFTGSYGTLGTITQLTFRLYPIQEASGTVLIIATPDKISQIAGILRGSGLTPTDADIISSGLISSLDLRGLDANSSQSKDEFTDKSQDNKSTSNLGLVVRFQSIKESVEEQSRQLLEIAEKLGIVGITFCDADEEELWKLLHLPIYNTSEKLPISCKIGVLPAAASEVISQLEFGYIHNASGLGLINLANEEDILRMRSICQNYAGFLSILEAPKSIKKKLDIWGYQGNGLNLMEQIKSKFDPDNILNPGRFVGGI